MESVLVEVRTHTKIAKEDSYGDHIKKRTILRDGNDNTQPPENP
jgi:hypothetical protein